jgi:hypothetical protein
MSALLEKYVTPMMGYYVCHHFVGNEPDMVEASIPRPSSNDMIRTGNFNVRDSEIVYVQVDWFQHFATKILPHIRNRFYLITGQWNLPALCRSALTDRVLNDSKVIAWMAQNPVYQHHAKYFGVPYGVLHKCIASYDQVRQRGLPNERSITLVHQWCNPETHPERKRLLKDAGWIYPEDFYEKLRNSRFVISPAGDRDDCYRHLDAIGLGCRPISNVNDTLRDVYSFSMLPATIDEMNKFIQTPSLLDSESSHVNPDLVLTSHWISRLTKTRMSNK